jgi:hypothetical protein
MATKQIINTIGEPSAWLHARGSSTTRDETAIGGNAHQVTGRGARAWARNP